MKAKTQISLYKIHKTNYGVCCWLRQYKHFQTEKDHMRPEETLISLASAYTDQGLPCVLAMLNHKLCLRFVDRPACMDAQPYLSLVLRFYGRVKPMGLFERGLSVSIFWVSFDLISHQVNGQTVQNNLMKFSYTNWSVKFWKNWELEALWSCFTKVYICF